MKTDETLGLEVVIESGQGKVEGINSGDVDGKELAVNILHPALDVRIMEAALDGDAAKERLKCSPSWASNRARYGCSSARRDGSRSGRSGWSMIARQCLDHSHGGRRKTTKRVGVENGVDRGQGCAELSQSKNSNLVQIGKINVRPSDELGSRETFGVRSSTKKVHQRWILVLIWSLSKAVASWGRGGTRSLGFCLSEEGKTWRGNWGAFSSRTVQRGCAVLRRHCIVISSLRASRTRLGRSWFRTFALGVVLSTTEFVKFLEELDFLGKAVDGILHLVETSNKLSRYILVKRIVFLGTSALSADPR